MSVQYIETDPVRLARYDALEELEFIRNERLSPINNCTLKRLHTTAKLTGLLMRDFRIVVRDAVYSEPIVDGAESAMELGRRNLHVPESISIIGKFVGYAQLNTAVFDKAYQLGLTFIKLENIELTEDRIHLDDSARIYSPILGVQYIEQLN